MKKQAKGITLIALVITIIILLILAGISIAMLTGENGILTKATQAEEETKKAQYEELVNIIILEKQLERMGNPNHPEPFIKVVADAIKEKEWSEEVMICDENENIVEPEKGTKIIVQTKDEYEIIVNIDNHELKGEVVSVTKGKGKTKDTIKIRFNNNEGFGEMEDIDVLTGNSTKLPNNTFIKEGWTFKQWNTLPDGTGINYPDGATVNFTENTELYAIWEENITLTLNVSNNKILPNSQMTIGAKATTGVQKVELKVGNNILFTNNAVGGIQEYTKNNLAVGELNKTAFENLPFYDIGLEVWATSTTGNTKSQTFTYRNYTIGNPSALEKFAEVVDGGASFSGETIYLLKGLTIGTHNPIGFYKINGDEKAFSGTFEGNNNKIVISSYQVAEDAGGLFAMTNGATIQNLTVEDVFPNSEIAGGIVGCSLTSTIFNCHHTANQQSNVYTKYRGGIVGQSINSKIERCSSSGNVIAQRHAGGILGTAFSGKIEIKQCYNEAQILVTGTEENR